ncbi:MAG TPA: SPOR domain-containing protein [Nevskiaceae bacterium]|nr:SPOR domain-containing protein [Nevskiaceae bacterium]
MSHARSRSASSVLALATAAWLWPAWALAAMSAPSAPAPAVAASVVAATPAPPPDELEVTDMVGNAQRLREGRHSALQPRATLVAGDVIEFTAPARARLAFGAQGNFGVADGAQVTIETKPDPEQRGTPLILNLQSGALHAQWRAAANPQHVSPALYVYVADSRVALQPGEYFLDAAPGAAGRVCVVNGVASVRAVAGAAAARVPSGQCLDIAAGGFVSAPFGTVAQAAAVERFVLPQPVAAPTVVAAAASAAATVQPARRAAVVAMKAASVQRLAVSAGPHAPAKLSAAVGPAHAVPTADRSGPASAMAGGWAINVASYANRADAEAQRKQLSAAGHAATVVRADVNGQTWYRVQIIGFSSRDEAHAQVASLESTNVAGRGLWITRRQ